MKDFIHNKATKDRKLSSLLRKTITKCKNALGLEFQDVANELGLAPGTLKNKVTPSYAEGDITLTEYIHLLELMPDFESLEYIAKEFDFILIKNVDTEPTDQDINTLVDKLSIENAKAFKIIKEALEQGGIDADEKAASLREVEHVIKKATELKNQLERL